MKKNKEYKKKLLQFKTALLFVVIGMVLVLTMSAISYVIYTNNMNSSFGKICNGVSQVIAGNIDGDKVENWLENEDLDSYYHTKQTLFKIRNSVSDIENIYVYKPTSKNLIVLMDVKKVVQVAHDLGSTVEYDGKWSRYKSSLQAGKNIGTMSTDDIVLTSVTPVYDSVGVCVAYACCDISLQSIATDRATFMKKLIIPMGALTSLILLLAIFYVEKHVVHPINRLDVYLRNYVLDNSKEELVKQKLRKLKIDTGNEINLLRDNSISMMDSISGYTQEVSKIKDNTLSSIVSLLNNKNSEKEDYSKFVAKYAEIILNKLREIKSYKDAISDEKAAMIVDSAQLYDIGEISVSDSILNKPGKLTDEEFKKIQEHTINGSQIIEESIQNIKDSEYIQTAKDMALYHHEHWDGTGYPNGLAGEEIPLSARIIAVADVFNALLSKRAYKSSVDISEAFNIISKESGTHFDPAVVRAFLSSKIEIEKAVEENIKSLNES